jgi:hypothetical protein
MILGRNTNQIAAFLAILLNLFISFGLRLTVEQVSLINAAIVAGLALLAYSNSTPVSEPRVPEGTKVTVETQAGEPNKVVTV